MVSRAAIVIATVWVSGLGCSSAPTDHESTSDDGLIAPLSASVESSAPSASASASGAPVSYPLHDWMKANAATSLAARDSKRLAHAMRRLESMAPQGFDSWPQLCERAAAAAEASDFAAARAVCSECHDKYRPDYKKSYRQRALSTE